MGGSNREREECISLPKMCHSLYNTTLIILPNANAIKLSVSDPESILVLFSWTKYTIDLFFVLRMTHFTIPLNWRLPSEVSNNIFSKTAFTCLEQNIILNTLDCCFWLYFQKFWHNFAPKKAVKYSSFFNFFRKMSIIQH